MILEKIFTNTSMRQKDALALGEAALLIVLGLLVFEILPDALPPHNSQSYLSRTDEQQPTLGVYDVALPRAKEWDANPLLVSISPFSDSDTARGYRVRFSSDTKQHIGYEVVVKNGEVVRSGEIPLYEQGSIPPELISEEEAVAKLHAIPGYEHEEIISISLVYEARTWFWAIKTKNHGVITFNAAR